MAATVYGTPDTYGLADESGGLALYLASLSCSISTEQAFVKNHQGEDRAVSLYNEATEITGSGAVVAAGAIGKNITAALTLVAGNQTIYAEGSASTFCVTSLSFNRSNTDFEMGDFTAIGRSGITVS